MLKCPSHRPWLKVKVMDKELFEVLHTSHASIAGTQQANCCRAAVNQFVAFRSSEAVEYASHKRRCVDNLSCGAEIVICLVFFSHDKKVICYQCLTTSHHSYKACRRHQLSMKIISILFGPFSSLGILLKLWKSSERNTEIYTCRIRS